MGGRVVHTRKQADVTTGDGSIAGDGNDGGLDGDFDDLDELDDDLDDDLIEQLRQADPVDVDDLPSSRSAKAMKTLNEILGPDVDGEPRTVKPEAEKSEPQAEEPEAELDESSPSPAAGDCGGREAPPPCPTSR